MTDNINNNLGIQTTGLPIDTSVAGEFIITYDAVDQAGNTAVQVKRTVTVEDPAQAPAPNEPAAPVDEPVAPATPAPEEAPADEPATAPTPTE